MIITKKQIMLACLTLVLGVAVYVNYILAQGDSLELKNEEPANSSAENYGEAEFVSKSAADKTDDDYFTQARLEKLNSRDTAVETLQSIIGGRDLSSDEMVTKAIEAANISQYIEDESNIEMLVKALGFEECLAYLDGETVKLVVKCNELTTAQAAAIKDIILTETSVLAENIRIYEVK